MRARGIGRGSIRFLLRAYPVWFRARFGDAMEYALVREHEAARQSGWAAAVWFWMRTAVSLCFHGGLERVSGNRGRTARGPAGSMASSSGPRREELAAGPASTAPDPLPRSGRGLRWNAADQLQEIRHALRRLGRNPGFALTALVTLGLGIGATTSIFSIVNAVILRPLPYVEPDGLVAIRHSSPTDELGITDAAWFHYGDRARSLSRLAIYIESSTSISGTGEPLELGMIQATPELLEVLQVEPVMGRNLTEDDLPLRRPQ